MEVEAAVNRLEALVEKVNSDLNYAIVRLTNEFSASFEGELDCEINPVRLTERLEQVKETFKILTSEAEEIEDVQKKIAKTLCTAISGPIKHVHEVQLQAGMQPSDYASDELSLLANKFDKTVDNENQPQFTEVEHKDTLQDAKTMQSSRASSKDFLPVTQEEFMAVSNLERRKSKLEDVNQVYEKLFQFFNKHPKSSLTLKDMARMGLDVSGATGTTKLQVLKTLKIIQINKQGTVKML